MPDGLAQVTYGHYMICGASLEAKPFILHFLYSFHQQLRLNLLLAVPAFQVADERRGVGPWSPLQVLQSYKLVTQSDGLGTNT